MKKNLTKIREAEEKLLQAAKTWFGNGGAIEPLKDAIQNLLIAERPKTISEKEFCIESPIVGKYIYVPTQMYIDRGEDDIMGGIAKISNIQNDSYTNTFVSVEGIRGHAWNWVYLKEMQGRLRAQFKNQFAYEDPDYG